MCERIRPRIQHPYILKNQKVHIHTKEHMRLIVGWMQHVIHLLCSWSADQMRAV